MSKFAKFAMALSCFSPLFLIFGAENGCAAVCAFSREDVYVISEIFKNQSYSFRFNAILSGVWLLLLIVGIGGIIYFHKSFLKATKLSKKSVKIVKAENITADYYFTYFSLFVISFFGIDPTKCKDILVFEIRVFSREHLNRKIGENLYVTYSPHDFSVCYPIKEK